MSTAPWARIALLGTGTVGSAVLSRLRQWQAGAGGQALQLVAVANTRGLQLHDGGYPARVVAGHDREHDRGHDHAAAAVRALGPEHTRIVVDATASDEVAGRHAAWLAAGIHVVTACKLGQGTALSRWRAIRAASDDSGCRYGDSATVGAGLPVLRSIRALQAGGDRILGIAGVLSGSLAWLLSRYDGSRPFAGLVEQARELGYTEPDPRIDLGGEDVRRKLLILARTSGIALEAESVRVAPVEAAALQSQYASASAQGKVLRHVARLQRGADGMAASVGVEALDATDPLAGAGSDNRIAIWSDRYARQPLLVQGPGAGAEVTAAALLDDALDIARSEQAYVALAGLRSSEARYSSIGRGWSIA